ncbi:MAG: NUDIX domain-containing protein [Bacteroidota bacterium]
MNTNLSYKDAGVKKSGNGIIDPSVYKIILDHVPVVCVDLLVLKGRKVFLIKRKNKPCEGIYWVQGGRMFKNEEITECGIRKTASELDIPENKIRIIRYLGTFSTQFSDSHQGSAAHTINITYLAAIDDIPVSFDEDHSDGKWFPIDGSMPGELQGKHEHHPYICELLKLLRE